MLRSLKCSANRPICGDRRNLCEFLRPEYRLIERFRGGFPRCLPCPAKTAGKARFTGDERVRDAENGLTPFEIRSKAASFIVLL